MRSISFGQRLLDSVIQIGVSIAGAIALADTLSKQLPYQPHTAVGGPQGNKAGGVVRPVLRASTLIPQPGPLRFLYRLNLAPGEAALLVYVLVFIFYVGGLTVSHRMVGDPAPSTIVELLLVAPGEAFYYPDLNAILFDAILHPIEFALIAYLGLVVLKRGEATLQLKSELLAVDTENKDAQDTSFDAPSWIILHGLPLLLAGLAVIFAYQTRYRLYDLAQPLATAALIATGLGFYGSSALSIRALYMAWVLPSTPPSDPKSVEAQPIRRKIVSALVLASVIFIVEAFIQWATSDFKAVPRGDILRLGAIVTGIGTGVGVLTALLSRFTKSTQDDSTTHKFTGGILLPSVIILGLLSLLTVRLFIQVYAN